VSAECKHGLDTDRHFFEFDPGEYNPRRNIYNPLHPVCRVCGVSIADLLRERDALRARVEALREALNHQKAAILADTTPVLAKEAPK